MIYLALFGTGKIIFGNPLQGVFMLVAAAVCAAFIFWDLGRRGWETLSE